MKSANAAVAKIPRITPTLLTVKGKNMLGKCVELLVNLPGQTKGNIGEVVREFMDLIHLEMSDGSFLIVLAEDVKPL